MKNKLAQFDVYRFTNYNRKNMSITTNAIYQADCLELLERITAETASLIYIDPPRYSPESEVSKDKSGNTNEGFRQYLNFLSQIVQQSHRILSNSGSLFFHAEPMLAGSSVRLILDQVFTRENYRTEFTWPYRNRPSIAKSLVGHDVILLYSKTNEYTLNRQFRPLSKSEINMRYPNSDERGQYMLTDLTSPVPRPNLQFEWKGFNPPKTRSWRYSKETLDRLEMEGMIFHPFDKHIPKLKAYLAENRGIEIGSVWDDIPQLSPAASEHLKYPSQKPVALLVRIIQMGSNVGDVVIDPFYGSGTTLVVAQGLGRKWIGSDLSEEAFSLSVNRICKQFNLRPNTDFRSGNAETLNGIPIVYNLYNPVITGLEDFTRLKETRFTLDQPVLIEETRHFEFKEIKGAKPIESIVNTADEYAVAFLNSEGGCLFWGIRNEDKRTVGVRLSFKERDRLRRVASEKLNGIKPKIDPTQYRIVLHQVYDVNDKTIPDVWVVELRVPRPIFPGPYFTGSDKLFAKVDGIKLKLEGPTLAEWIMRRQRNS